MKLLKLLVIASGWCLKPIEIRKPLASNSLPTLSPLPSSGQGGAAMDEDLSRFCCQNQGCPDHGKRAIGNLTACARYGKDKQHRLLYCRTCRYRFSERKGTPLFGSQLPPDKADSVFRHLADRNGVRATARLVGVAPNTVVRYGRLAGGHARALHDELVELSPPDHGDPVRREVVVRLQEADALRPG